MSDKIIQTVVFDFDGVIHSYTSGWQGAVFITDPPVPGIKEALRDIRNAGYEIVIVSTRCTYTCGMEAIKKWLDKYDIAQYVDRICKEKPPAVVYIDDRAICFDGRPDTLLDKIRRFTPWNKHEGYMCFGQAIELMKEGKRVARKGWNGKNQHIELASNISYIDASGFLVNCKHEAIGNNAIAFVGTSGVQMGWLASQADMLAEDWMEVTDDL